MKKTSMNFADHQAAALTEHAAALGIGFAEIVRRALDEWLVAKREKRPMTPVEQSGAIVHLKFAEDDYTKTFRNVEVVELYDSIRGIDRIEIMRGERTLASFERSELKYWYVDEQDDAS